MHICADHSKKRGCTIYMRRSYLPHPRFDSETGMQHFRLLCISAVAFAAFAEDWCYRSIYQEVKPFPYVVVYKNCLQSIDNDRSIRVR